MSGDYFCCHHIAAGVQKFGLKIYDPEKLRMVFFSNGTEVHEKGTR